MSKVPKLRFPEFEGEWEEKELGEVGEFIGGGTPNTSIPEYWDGEISWYTPTEIKEDTYLLKKSRRKITELGLRSSSAKLLPKGSVLITTRATIGDVAIVNEPCATNQGFQSLVVKENQINRFWFYWIIKNRKLLIKKASGSTFKEIAKNEIIKIRTIVPQKKEQQKIADCLSSLDELIEARREKIASLKAYKKGLLQQLFPEGVSKSTPPPLIFNKLPKLRFEEFEGEWEEVTIESIFKITRGNVLPMTLLKQEYSEEYPYPVYSSQTKNNGLAGYYNEFLYENAITWTTDGANAGEVNYRKEKFYCTNVCGVLISEKGYANKCIAELINSVSKSYVSYVGNPKLMNGVMGSIKIQIPTEQKEQQKIADCLLSLDEKIAAETEQVTQLQQHKKGLLQQLLV